MTICIPLGYRKMNPGELRRRGDKFQWGGKWKPVVSLIGFPINNKRLFIRKLS